jgi:hypothetical protein
VLDFECRHDILALGPQNVDQTDCLRTRRVPEWRWQLVEATVTEPPTWALAIPIVGCNVNAIAHRPTKVAQPHLYLGVRTVACLAHDVRLRPDCFSHLCQIGEPGLLRGSVPGRRRRRVSTAAEVEQQPGDRTEIIREYVSIFAIQAQDALAHRKEFVLSPEPHFRVC